MLLNIIFISAYIKYSVSLFVSFWIYVCQILVFVLSSFLEINFSFNFILFISVFLVFVTIIIMFYIYATYINIFH